MKVRCDRLWPVIGLVGVCVAIPDLPVVAQTHHDVAGRPKTYRGRLGAGSSKIKREGDKTFLWAGPRGQPIGGPDSNWYDFTGAVIPAEELQFGIGKDSIPAIDDPLFVSPDDPRLLELGSDPYDPAAKPVKTSDDIPVIGYAVGDDVRAYPVRLLDRHELVNDRVGGKPVTVGW